jgi:hypothetical protein
MNLEDSIAITQNFVSPRNLARVLHFLRERRDQVSGYCEAGVSAEVDVPATTTAPRGPRELYEVFVDALQAHGGYAELLERAMQESHALAGIGGRGRKRKAAPSSSSLWAPASQGGDATLATPASFAFTF